jgi:hypothetical protein
VRSSAIREQQLKFEDRRVRLGNALLCATNFHQQAARRRNSHSDRQPVPVVAHETIIMFWA